MSQGKRDKNQAKEGKRDEEEEKRGLCSFGSGNVRKKEKKITRSDHQIILVHPPQCLPQCSIINEKELFLDIIKLMGL